MGKLTLQELENHLWGAANILRGKIDSSDYKHYIFGLLFFKRISDVWQEEYNQRMKEFNDKKIASDPDEHRFHIPKGAFWSDVRKESTNIGSALNIAFNKIEDANLRLKGIFQDVDFNNKERFPDKILELLLQHFDKYNLSNSNVEPDILGNAYEYLIAQFADDAGKKGGEFYTPKMVVRLLVEFLKPDESMSIYDPCAGSGGMLIECVHYLQRKKKNYKTLSLHAQEMNLNTWAICKMNFFLHDIDDVNVDRGDTLREPKNLVSEKSKALKTFDRVIANPPFSLKNWGYDDWKKGDKFGRDKYGCPPASYGDLAFVQHMLASLKSDGMLGVVLPHGILFRGGAEGKIREGLIRDDKIEAVIGLASNLFYGTGIPACLLVINNAKPKNRRGKILIVNGAEEYQEGKNQNTLTKKNVDRLAKTFHTFKDEERFARVVDKKEVEKYEFNLNISRYIQVFEVEETIDVKTELITLMEMTGKRDKAEKLMLKHMKELGYDT